jgi:hypothetical protein
MDAFERGTCVRFQFGSNRGVGPNTLIPIDLTGRTLSGYATMPGPDREPRS